MSAKAIIAISLLLLGLIWWRIELGGGVYKNDQLDASSLTNTFIPWRDELVHRTEQLLPATQAQLLTGMLIGVQDALPTDFKDQLISTSTIHIVVVSGQNLSLVVGFLLAFSPLFGRKPTILLAVAGITGYSLLTGLTVPVIRAAIMAGLVLAAKWWGRESQSGWILLLAGLIMILIWPSWLLSISFQLSFAATFGALIFSKTVYRWLGFLPEILRGEVAVTLSAQLLTLPIIAANFHRVSLFGAFANLFVLWTVPLIMLAGLIILVLSFIFWPLAQLAAIWPNLLLTYFIDIILLFAQLPLAQVEIYHWSLYFSLGIYALILGVWLHYLGQAEDSTPLRLPDYT